MPSPPHVAHLPDPLHAPQVYFVCLLYPQPLHVEHCPVPWQILQECVLGVVVIGMYIPPLLFEFVCPLIKEQVLTPLGGVDFM